MTKSRDLGDLAQTVAVNLPATLGTASQVLQVNSGANGLEFASVALSSLSADLDTNGHDIVTSSNADLDLAPNGTVVVKGDASFAGAIDEAVYNLTGTALDPANGTIQYKTLSTNTTLTDSLSEGESITLMIDDGSSYSVTFPTITWVNNGGAAPTLATTGYTVISLWKVSTTLYGALVGNGE